jgi:hypothetical protein
MGWAMERDTELLLQAVDAVHDSDSLDDALNAIVEVLQQRFELWYASFATIPSGSSQLELLASWSFTRTVFDAGAQISTAVSPTAEEAIEALRQGLPALVSTTDSDSLLGHLLSQQGVAAIVTLPVHVEEGSMLMLGLGSSSKDALRTAVPGFFEGLTAGIKEKVLRLANSPTS